MMVQHPFTGWQFYFELDAHGNSSFFQCLAGAEDLELSDYYDDAVYMLATPLLTSNVIYIQMFHYSHIHWFSLHCYWNSI
jgi:hypothetical protein